MKKCITIAMFCGFAFTSWSQESSASQSTEKLVNKNGHAILPEKGDYGLGFNAVPFFNYLGNSFNGSSGNSVNTGFVNSYQTIYGKYFWNDKTVLRAEFRFAQRNSTTNNFVSIDGSSHPDDFTEDKRRTNFTSFTLGVGVEKRRGWGRVQAFYGAGLFYQLTRSAEIYTYGNDFSSTNPTPTSTVNFNSGASAQVGDRISYVKNSPTNGIGLRLFVGVEYFFAPRMSIGGEFGWGALANFAGDSQEGRIRYNTQEEEYTRAGRTTQSFNLDTDNLNGAINLMVYF